jgi:hypothetical protein
MTTTYQRPSCFTRPRSTWDRYDYAAVRRFNEQRRHARQERPRVSVAELRALFTQETTP